MKAILPVSGFGTRLGHITNGIPKSLLDIGNQTIMDVSLDAVDSLYGIDGVYLVANDVSHAHFAKYLESRDSSVPINLLNDRSRSADERLGTVGTICFALEIESVRDDLIILFSDNLFDFKLRYALARFYEGEPRKPLIVAHDAGSLERARNFGVLNVNDLGRIVSFEEKPDEPKSTLVSTGIYFFPRDTINRFFEYKEERKWIRHGLDRMGDFIVWLMEREEVHAYSYSPESLWIDIGTPDTYREAVKRWGEKIT